MKSIQAIFLSTAFLFLGFITRAQSLDEVVNKHLEAMGGKDKISKINSVYMEGTVSVMGSDNPFNTTILNGKGYKTETEFNGSKIIQVLTDKGGWAINPMTGSAEATPIPDEQYNTSKNQIYVGAPFMDYAQHNIQLSLDGNEDGAIKVKAVNDAKTETTYYIDPTTYYIKKSVSKAEMMGQEMEVTISYSDYQKTDYGFVVARSMESDFGGQFQMTSSVKKVEVNKAIDPTIFEMPK